MRTLQFFEVLVSHYTYKPELCLLRTSSERHTVHESSRYISLVTAFAQNRSAIK